MLETQRLRLLPLNYLQLLLYLHSNDRLEQELQLQPSRREISEELREALEYSILPNVANPARNSLFYTLWTLISKADRQMIGDLCFKGEPDENGHIEIGYGTYPAFEGKGYMTEAVGAMIRWAGGFPDVKAVLAETEKMNTPSRRILEKNGFVVYREDEDKMWWRREL